MIGLDAMSLELFSDDMIVGNSDIRPSDTGWVSVSDDPYFILSVGESVKIGWYRFKLKLKTNVEVTPKLYFDFGLSFNEHFSSELSSIGADTYEAIIHMEQSPSRIRLDPIDAVGDFDIKSLELEYMSDFKFWQFAAFKALKMLVNNPVANFKRLIVTGKSLTQSQRFRSVSPKVRYSGTKNSYANWRAKNDYDPIAHRSGLKSLIDILTDQPLISIIMPVYNTELHHLDAAIESVSRQIYKNWELCICDDGSNDPDIRKTLEKWVGKDDRIKLVFHEENGHIVKATNSAFGLATGTWIAMMDHDDVISENALAEIIIAINNNPDCQIIYSDEDKIDETGQRIDPHFKPDFSPELFRSMNYFNHLTVHRADNIRAVRGWDNDYIGSQDYDLNLKIWEKVDDVQIVHIPKILYHWRQSTGSTAIHETEKNYALNAGRKALEAHLERSKIAADVTVVPDAPYFRVHYAVQHPPPLVTLIIPTKDKAGLLKTCISSILEKTTYSNYEILIVDNGSREAETHRYFKRLSSNKKIRIIEFNGPFNFSAINNYAVGYANGEIVGLVNNDIKVITPDWLTEMVSWAQQDRVGCVGAKLYYANDLIQHAGVIVGLGGVAGHSHKYFQRDDPGYFHRLKLCQNLSAVTAACLVIRKSIYQEVGGLNEEYLAVAYNDVDFGLKVKDAGYVNVWTPFAELYHFESISRGSENSPEKIKRYNSEVEYMLKTWGGDLKIDPYYSPNLTPNLEDFSLRT